MVSNPLTALFGKSPIAPIQEHMEIAHACAEGLKPFFQAAVAGDWEAAARHQRYITEKEHAADDLKKKVRINLPKNLFLPVPRSDLLDLVRIQDKVANYAKDIAGLMLGRQMAIPAPLAAAMVEYVDCAVATSAQALKAIEELDELLETGFRGREVELVETLIVELDRLEHDNDQLQVDVRAQLFKLERELPPVDVIFLYRIIDWVGELANRAQSVGARLQILLAR